MPVKERLVAFVANRIRDMTALSRRDTVHGAGMGLRRGLRSKSCYAEALMCRRRQCCLSVAP